MNEVYVFIGKCPIIRGGFRWVSLRDDRGDEQESNMEGPNINPNLVCTFINATQ